MKVRFLLPLVFAFSSNVVADMSKVMACYKQQNYSCAFAEAKELATNGDAEAQHMLGILYNFGQGVEQNYESSFEWHQKAANQGQPLSQKLLGLMYLEGEGVKPDFRKAIKWYKKAAEQGDSGAKYTIRTWLMRQPKSICNELAITEIFGMKVICATRSEMRDAVKSSGGTVIREESSYFGDIYNSSSLLKGSSELLILYTLNSAFAKAQYTFPSSMDVNQVTRVRDLVASKYGEPHQSDGYVKTGEVSFIWRLNDGILMHVKRGWPNTTTFLTFTHPENLDTMNREIKQSEAEESQKQRNAF